MTCTRCETSGFLNLHQVDEETLREFARTGDHEVIKKWMLANPDSDVSVCDCCGNREHWHGTPGEHDARDNGPSGPYAYNGGLPQCN